MPRVLIIVENLQQYDRLKSAFTSDEDVQVSAANLRQINPKNLRMLRQVDLVVLESSLNNAEHPQTEESISFLKRTGLPTIVLPPITEGSSSTQEPLILNLAEHSVSQTGLAALLNIIRAYYVAELKKVVHDIPSQPISSFHVESNSHNPQISASTRGVPLSSRHSVSSQPLNNASKMTHTLSAIRKISDQLREPLSNMNLAIHMLGRVQSLEERDRYLRLLREEYNRELQLLNQLDNHLETNLPRAT